MLLDLLPVIGEVAHVESYFSFRSVRRSPAGVPQPADLQLLDILPHPVYLLLPALEAAQPNHTTELAAVEIGPRGTVHALVTRGSLTATLVVTLEGRPIESYLRVIGTNGMLHADFVRGTVQRLIGPGTTTIDKILAPFSVARQLGTGTSAALMRRFAGRQRYFPGLSEIVQAFYESIIHDRPPPVSPDSIIDTTRIWEGIASTLNSKATQTSEIVPRRGAPGVLLTGGTGFFGKAIARVLSDLGTPVRVIGRRPPASWECIPGVDYLVADAAEGIPETAFAGIETVIHCAAETAGGWEAHQRNSIDATERTLRSAAKAGVRRIIHTSSMAVPVSKNAKDPLAEDSRVETNNRKRGPYAWGKSQSEILAQRLAQELDLDLRIIRPGAIVDWDQFDPPGALGKRLGGLFVAVGSPKDLIGTVDLDFAARAVAWMTRNFDEAPEMLHLLDAKLPTKREIASRLKRSNPDLKIVWLPRLILVPLSWLAIIAQRLVRPRRSPINVAKVFSKRHYDLSRIAALAPVILENGKAKGEPPAESSV
jgi:nucleoside-diphosphate-sugar epimerase